MHLKEITKRLFRNAEIIRNLIKDIGEEQARWKPEPHKWSILEVINHLCDEEKEDFRKRVDLTLNHPGKPWPGINPEGWVEERGYNKRNLNKSLKNFIAERQKSIAWLNSLSDPSWDNIYEHPQIGKISAGDLMAAWLGHDLIHIKQIAMLHVDYIKKLIPPYSTDYALPRGTSDF